MSKGFKNVYVCQECGGKIVTLDLDEGTTPFMLRCRSGRKKGCNGTMQSSFYQVDQTLPVDYVWFAPDSLDGHDEAMQDHIKKGGLDIRKATPTETYTKAVIEDV